MTIRNIVFAILFATLAMPAAAQQLTSSEIQAAIAAGADKKPGDIGLFLENNGGAFRASLPMKLVIFSPSEWIELVSAKAAQRFQNLTASGVSSEMSRPVLRVVAAPGSSISVLVVRNTSKNQVVQPISEEFCSEAMNFGGGFLGTVSPDCKIFVFPLQDVQNLRDEDGEFLITLRAVGSAFGTGAPSEINKDFEVKRKHLNKLPGLR